MPDENFASTAQGLLPRSVVMRRKEWSAAVEEPGKIVLKEFDIPEIGTSVFMRVRKVRSRAAS